MRLYNRANRKECAKLVDLTTYRLRNYLFRTKFVINMTSETEIQKPATKQPFRVLSLDGGGAKGVYTLGVLKEVEAIANAPLCEVFDLVFGTSTGAIIAALIALGYKIEEIENLYFTLIPKIMKNRSSRGRTEALKAEGEKLFGDQDFSAFKTLIGIVCTNYDFERPMVFKNSVQQSHGRAATFKPGFGCTIAEAVIASCAAYPFFEKVTVKTANQGEPLLMDGGYVANNPTLFALADTYHALKKTTSEIAVLSVGVGSYNEPKRSIFHQIIFRFWPFRISRRCSTSVRERLISLGSSYFLKWRAFG